MFHNRLIAGTTASVALVAGFAFAAPRIGTAAPPQQAGAMGQPVAGISCDAQEGNRIHIHQHLLILDKGNPVPIPQSIGIPAGRNCIYWVHTHTPDGVIHIEAPKDRSFTLGDFFAIWGQPLSKTQASMAVAAKGQSLKVWVNGKAYTGDPRKIPLPAHADIVIESGPPFPTPPRFTNWGTL